MDAPAHKAAVKGLREWWASPPRSGMQRLIKPVGVPSPPRLRRDACWRWHRRGRHCHIHTLVQRLRVGSLLPGSGGAESRGRLLVPRHRSVPVSPGLSPADTCRGGSSYSPASGGSSPGHVRAHRGLRRVTRGRGVVEHPQRRSRSTPRGRCRSSRGAPVHRQSRRRCHRPRPRRSIWLGSQARDSRRSYPG